MAPVTGGECQLRPAAPCLDALARGSAWGENRAGPTCAWLPPRPRPPRSLLGGSGSGTWVCGQAAGTGERPARGHLALEAGWARRAGPHGPGEEHLVRAGQGAPETLEPTRWEEVLWGPGKGHREVVGGAAPPRRPGPAPPHPCALSALPFHVLSRLFAASCASYNFSFLSPQGLSFASQGSSTPFWSGTAGAGGVGGPGLPPAGPQPPLEGSRSGPWPGTGRGRGEGTGPGKGPPGRRGWGGGPGATPSLLSPLARPPRGRSPACEHCPSSLAESLASGSAGGHPRGDGGSTPGGPPGWAWR